MMKRWPILTTSLVLTSVLLTSGCGMLSKSDPESGGLNVPGKAEGEKQVSAKPRGMDDAFRIQYANQCKMQLKGMANVPMGDGPKNPDEVCDCVAEKMWEMREQGGAMDPMVMQDKLMACMGIDLDEMNRKVAEQRRMAEEMAEQVEGGLPSNQADQAGFQSNVITVPDLQAEPAEDFPGQNDNLDEEEQTEQPRREAKRNVKYDPKTGTWTNQ